MDISRILRYNDNYDTKELITINKVIFWDFDGTLVYSHHLWSGTLLKTLQLYTEDNKVTLEQIRPPMAYGFSWDTPDEDFTQTTGEKWWEFTLEHIRDVYKAVGLSDGDAERLLPLFRSTILERENFRIYPDAFDTLSQLREQGYRHYMVSNNFPELTDICHDLGFDRCFDGYIVSAQVGYDKPRREIFQLAYDMAGAPDECFMVGDNPRSDIKGALNFGIKAVLVHNDNDMGYSCVKCGSLSEILYKNI